MSNAHNHPSSLPLSDAPEAPEIAAVRWKRIGTTLTRFFSLQLVTQALLAFSGILLVRTLSRTEYGYFTIANTMQGAMNALADSGISIGVISIGGKVWQDKYRFGQLINSALFMRKRMAIAVVLVIAPIMLWTLLSNGASLFYAALLFATVLTALNAQLTIGVLEVVPRLRSEFLRFTKLDLSLAALRLIVIAITHFLFCDAAVAVMIGSATLLIKTAVLQKWAAEGIESHAPVSSDDQRDISAIIRRKAPLVVFYCLQGQITIWLLSFFGNVRSIAEIGALSGLTVIFGFFNSLTGNIVIPKFAKIQEFSALKLFYLRTVAAYSSLFFLLLAVVWYMPNHILWLLGHQYKNLQATLTLMTLSSVIYNLSGIIESLNAARAWIRLSWIYVPLTLGTQVIILLSMKVNTTRSAIIFGLISLFPGLLTNIFLSYNGFKSFRKEAAKSEV